MEQTVKQSEVKTDVATTAKFGGSYLLQILESLTCIHNLPFSKERALHGLPLQGKELTLDLFPRSARQVGLITKLVSKSPSAVPALVYPFVVLFKNGDMGIALEKTQNGNAISMQIAASTGKKEIPVAELDKECLKTVIYVTLSEESGVNQGAMKGTHQASGHWLWATVFRFWPTWIYLLFAALIVNLLGLALPLFVMNVYDRVIPYNSIPTLWALVIGVAIALFAEFVLRILRSTLINNSSRRIDMSVSSQLFEHALDAKMSGRAGQAGELANHVREFETVRDFFTSTGLISLIDLIFIGVFLGLLWLIVGPLAFVPLLAVPCVLIVTLLVQIPLSRSVGKTQIAATNRHAVLIESLVSIETVKAISAEGIMQKRWEDAVARSVRASSSTNFWSSITMFFTMFAQQAVSVILIVWGVFLVADGMITIGALIAANILAGRVLAPLGGVAMTVVRAQQSFGVLGFLNSLMKLQRDHEPTINARAKISDGRLEFRDVEFAYPNQGKNALDKISFTVSPGERVAVVGRVGSGKSSMGKLLCGLYEVSQGAIVIDDTDTRHHAIADVRSKVGYVSQETELFTGTLRDNVLLANPDAGDAFEKCASISGVTAIAQTHPLGFEMPVGERGKAISGGQRQSVGIARAMISDHKILFLDEPTSQMDTLTEAAFVNGFKAWLKPDTTLILATHRTSLLEVVDRIIVMEKGCVIADGPKDKVLATIAKGGLISSKKGKK